MKELLLFVSGTLLCVSLYAQVAVDINHSYNDMGGEIRLNNPLGNPNVLIQPDIDGVGGFIEIFDGLGNSAFQVDGNHDSGHGQVSISGLSTTLFNTGETGKNALILPLNGISSMEINNEAGLASSHGSGSFNFSGSMSVITSRTITVPSDGYVVAFASGQLNVTHVTADNSTVEFGLSDNTSSIPSNLDMNISIPILATAGLYVASANVHGVFDVTEGTHTFYFLGEKMSGLGGISMNEVNLTLLFIPTAYGTVTSSIVDEDGGSSRNHKDLSYDGMELQQLKDEKLQSMDSNLKRVQKEVLELKAILANYIKEEHPNR